MLLEHSADALLYNFKNKYASTTGRIHINT